MKKFISIFLFIVAVFTVNLKSENFNNYFPMQVGNVWVYNCSASGTWCMCSIRMRIKIVNTVVYNGKTYYHFQFTSAYSNMCGPLGCSSIYGAHYILRLDTTKSNVYVYSPGSTCGYSPNELLIDSLKARLNDTVWYQCTPPQQFNTYKCTDTNDIVIFGASRKSKQFGLSGFEGGFGNRFAYNIGLVQSGNFGMSCNNNSQLIGCVINGVLYGDTNLPLGINKISAEIPEKYSLYQNYPNPFNPNTKIRFEIPKMDSHFRGNDNVRLVIYNSLGQEITTLVNEQLTAGTYEFEFDGTDYPSGVYFYQLAADNFIESRKMLLIK